MGSSSQGPGKDEISDILDNLLGKRPKEPETYEEWLAQQAKDLFESPPFLMSRVVFGVMFTQASSIMAALALLIDKGVLTEADVKRLPGLLQDARVGEQAVDLVRETSSKALVERAALAPAGMTPEIYMEHIFPLLVGQTEPTPQDAERLLVASGMDVEEVKATFKKES